MNKIKLQIILTALLIVAANVTTRAQSVERPDGVPFQTTAFTYQGRLTDTSMAANGTFGFQFALFNDVASGTAIGTETVPSVTVANGIFTVNLDFGAAAFPDEDRYLEIRVKRPTDANYTTLTPRQQITSTPFAIRSKTATTADTATNATTANNALAVGGTSAANIIKEGDSRLSDARTPTAGSANYVQNTTAQQTSTNFNISGNGTIGGNLNVGGTITGDGSGLTNISAATVADGSITAAKIAPNVILNPNKVALLQWYDANRSIAPIAVGINPLGIAFDGTFMYVANVGSNTVTRIRASTGVVEGSPIAVGNGPGGIAFDGTFIYVVNHDDNNVTRIRASTGVVEGSPIAVGNNPSRIAFDGAFMYVTNSRDNTVTKF